jgi:hypothetical protein
MFHHLKNTLAIAALCVSFTQVAQASSCNEGDSLYPCGLEFTTIPAMPSLTAGATVTSDPYVLTNASSGPVTLNSVALVIQGDDTVGAGAVTINPSSTCVASTVLAANDTCDIVLSFQPATTGLLDWNLVVTPQSSQRPLALPITTTVAGPTVGAAYVVNSAISEGGTSSISYCPLDANLVISGACTPVTLNFAVSTQLNNAANIVFNAAGTMAYISNSGGGTGYDGTNITICPVVDPTTFGSGAGYCVNSADDFGGPMGMAFNADESFLYVANSIDPGSPILFGGGISQCAVNPDGSLGSCTFVSEGLAVKGIAFNSDFSYAYATLPSAPSVFSYTVDGSGALTFSSVFSDEATLAPVGILTFAGVPFITNATTLPEDNSFSICPNAGDISDCLVQIDNSSASNFASPAGLDLGFVDSSGIYFIANLNRISGNFAVSHCPGGSLSCTPMTDPSFNSPSDVFIVGIP